MSNENTQADQTEAETSQQTQSEQTADNTPSGKQNDPESEEQPSRADLINAILEISDVQGSHPNPDYIPVYSDYSADVFEREFGSLGNALDQAIVEYREMMREITYSELIENLHDLNNDDQDLQEKALVEECHIISTVFYDYFNSIQNMRAAIEIVSQEDATDNDPSIHSLLAEIRRVREEIDRNPLEEDIEVEGSYTVDQYTNQFGSLQNAKICAGIIPGNGDMLLDELRELGDPPDDPPSIEDLREQSEYEYHTYHRMFGSWRSALQTAGYTPPE